MDLNGITPVDAYSTTQPTKNTLKMAAYKALPTPKQEVSSLVIPTSPTTAMSIPSKVLDPITDALNRTLNSNDTSNSPPEESVQPVLSSQSASEPEPNPDFDSEYPPFLFNPQELSIDIPSYFSLKPFDPSKEVKKVGKLILGDALDFHKVVTSLPAPTKHSVTANNFNTNNSNARSYSAKPPSNTNANIRPQPTATHIPSKLNASSVKPTVAPVQQPKAYVSLVPIVTQAPPPQKSSSKNKPITLPKSTIEIIPNGVMAKGEYKPIDEPAIAINELVNGDISRLVKVDFEFAGENGAFVINAWRKDGVTKCKVPAIWTVTYRELDGSLKTVKMIGNTYTGRLFPSSKDEAGISRELWKTYLSACAYNLTARLAFDPVRKEAPFWGKRELVLSEKRVFLTNNDEIEQGLRNPTLQISIGYEKFSLPISIPSNLKFYLGTEVEICPDTVIEPPAPKPELKLVPPEILKVLSKDENLAENMNSILKAQYTANGERNLYAEGVTILNYLKSRMGGYVRYDSNFKDCEGAEEWDTFCFSIERLENALRIWRETGYLPKVSKYSDAYEFAMNYFFYSESSYPNMGYMGEEDRKIIPKIMAIKSEEFRYLWERPTIVSVHNQIKKWWKGGSASKQTRLGDVIWEIRKAQESGVIDASRMKMLQAQIPALAEGIAWFNYACHNPATYSGNYYYQNSLSLYNPSAYAELQGQRAFSANAYNSWQSQPMQLMSYGQYNPYCNIGTQNNLVFAKPRLPCVITQSSLPSISAHYVWMLNEQGQYTAPIEKYGILKKAQWIKYK